jgi:hypothetical protein
MSNSDLHGVPMNEIPLSVITAREPVQDNPWISERWRVLGVVAGANGGAGPIERLLLRSGPEGEQYLWTGFVLRLRPVEVESYYYNLIGDNPSVYIYCACEDAAGEPSPRQLTIDYIDAMANSESGNSSFAVPMPPDVYRRVEQFVLDHYVPEEPKMKRKHERESKDSGARGDD